MSEFTQPDAKEEPSAPSTDTKEESSPAAAAPSTDTKSTSDDKDAPEESQTEEISVSDVSEQLSKMGTDDKKHEISADSHLSSDLTFSDPLLNMPDKIRDAITLNLKFEHPSQIQAAALPIILRGKNLIAQAQSGAGKTLAFVVGLLNKIDVSSDSLQAICLSPTREVADQIYQLGVLPISSRIPGLRVERVLKGMQLRGRSRAHLVVGTPGKVKDLLTSQYLHPGNVKVFVVDEADEMLHNANKRESLAHDTLFVRQAIHPSAQVLFFSATFSDEVRDFCRRVVQGAYEITLEKADDIVLSEIMQVWVNPSNRKNSWASDSEGSSKLGVLQDIYSMMTIQQSIVFVESIKAANEVSRMMVEEGFTVSTLHSKLSSGEERDRVMNAFRAGESKVLITTNVLARGVDVPAVAVVVNYDLPTKRRGRTVIADVDTYIHRIGRTGRFGRVGTAISFVEGPDDKRILGEIESALHGDTPGKRIIKPWDVRDIEGLADLHNSRTEGMEATSNDKAPPTIKIFSPSREVLFSKFRVSQESFSSLISALDKTDRSG